MCNHDRISFTLKDGLFTGALCIDCETIWGIEDIKDALRDAENEQTVTRDVDHCTCTHPARWAGSVSNYCAKCDKPLRA
jgi:translation initiation factor 2 alpha subunit (eIF-2alpha)